MKVRHRTHSAGVQPCTQADTERKEARYAVDCPGLDVEQDNKLSLEIHFIYQKVVRQTVVAGSEVDLKLAEQPSSEGFDQ